MARPRARTYTHGGNPTLGVLKPTQNAQDTGSRADAPLQVSDGSQLRNLNLKSANTFHFGQTTGTILPQRPSTSGGPPRRRLVAKGGTKDDLHFNPPTANRAGSPVTQFNLPSLVPLSNTPQTFSKHPLPISSYCEAAPEYLIATPLDMNAESLGIGLALGSPSHPPASWPSNFQCDTSVTAQGMSLPAQKAKASKWKRLFGRRTVPPTPFYQLQQEGQAASYSGIPSPSYQTQGKASKKSNRDKTPAKRVSPTSGEHDHAKKDKRGRLYGANPDVKVDGRLLLDVDIPTIRMERYSIMFGSLLRQPSNGQQSNLLARRQATLDKLKTMDEAMMNKVEIYLE
jgi:hypothetical protein